MPREPEKHRADRLMAENLSHGQEPRSCNRPCDRVSVHIQHNINMHIYSGRISRIRTQAWTCALQPHRKTRWFTSALYRPAACRPGYFFVQVTSGATAICDRPPRSTVGTLCYYTQTCRLNFLHCGARTSSLRVHIIFNTVI